MRKAAHTIPFSEMGAKRTSASWGYCWPLTPLWNNWKQNWLHACIHWIQLSQANVFFNSKLAVYAYTSRVHVLEELISHDWLLDAQKLISIINQHNFLSQSWCLLIDRLFTVAVERWSKQRPAFWQHFLLEERTNWTNTYWCNNAAFRVCQWRLAASSWTWTASFLLFVHCIASSKDGAVRFDRTVTYVLASPAHTAGHLVFLIHRSRS